MFWGPNPGSMAVPLTVRACIIAVYRGCCISLLLLIALFAIRQVANAERLSRLSAATNAAERDASEGRYRSLVELSPDVLFVNAAGKIAYVNAAAIRFFGAKNAAELIGRSPLEFVADASKPLEESRIRELMTRGGFNPPVAEDWLRLDGSSVPVEAISAIVPWRDGSVAIQVIPWDISERQTRREKKKNRDYWPVSARPEARRNMRAG